MYPHRIRLRGPWQCEPLARTPKDANIPLPAPLTMTMPCRWRDGGLPGFAGKVRFRRRFGYPGRIDDYERVWLTFGDITGVAEIQLNGELLGKVDNHAKTTEFDVTQALRARNELVADLEAANDAGGLWGEIALEVRCTAFLRHVRCALVFNEQVIRLNVCGEVVGTCDRKLELYAIAGRSTVAYRTIDATPNGQAFQMLSDPLPGDSQRDLPVRVDLVNGACTWYVVEGGCEGTLEAPTA
jgi:hypothetical protein